MQLVMEYCTKGYLPATEFLARNFAVCDFLRGTDSGIALGWEQEVVEVLIRKLGNRGA